MKNNLTFDNPQFNKLVGDVPLVPGFFAVMSKQEYRKVRHQLVTQMFDSLITKLREHQEEHQTNFTTICCQSFPDKGVDFVYPDEGMHTCVRHYAVMDKVGRLANTNFFNPFLLDPHGRIREAAVVDFTQPHLYDAPNIIYVPNFMHDNTMSYEEVGEFLDNVNKYAEANGVIILVDCDIDKNSPWYHWRMFNTSGTFVIDGNSSLLHGGEPALVLRTIRLKKKGCDDQFPMPSNALNIVSVAQTE